MLKFTTNAKYCDLLNWCTTSWISEI